MIMPKSELPAGLSRQLRAFERKLRLMEGVVAVSGAGAGLLVSWLVVYFSDRLWDTPWPFRIALALAGTVTGAFFAWYWLRYWIIRRRDLRQLAKLIQHEYRQLGDRLQGIVELTQEEQPDDISPALVHAAIRQVARQTEDVDFRQAVKTERSWNYGFVFFLSLLVFVALCWFNPAAGMNALRRWLDPTNSVARYTFVKLDDLPAEWVVPHGEPQNFRIGIDEDSFKKPGTARILIPGQAPLEAPVRREVAEFLIPGQTREAMMQIKVWDVTREVKIKPVHRPTVKKLYAFVTYPDYLLKSPIKQEVNAGHLTVLDGSSVKLRGELGRKLNAAEIRAEGALQATPASLTEEGFMTPAIKPDGSRQYVMTWTDKYDLTPRRDYRVEMHIEQDRMPFVTFPNQPRYEALLIDEAKEIEIQAEDDHGLRTLGIEWYVTDAKGKRLTPMNYSQEVVKGNANAANLRGSFIFAPSVMKIPPQTIVVMTGVTTDYYPDRGDVHSTVHKIYILSRAEHAKEIKRRFEALQARLEDITRSEENIQDKTMELQNLEPDKLKSDQVTEQIKQLQRDEHANRRELERLAKEGMKLLEEAMRNKDFSEELLKEWARMLQGMKNISGNEMNQSSQSLGKARQSRKNPGRRKQQLGDAAKQQEEAIKKLQKLLKDLNDSIEDMTARNFVNRLRRLAGDEKQIKSRLQQLLAKTVGADFDSLSQKLKREIRRIAGVSRDVQDESELIMDDLTHFFNRTRIAKYDEVFQAMQQASLLDNLDKHTKTIKANKSISAMQQADHWATQFEKWAKMLEQANKKKSQGQGKSGQMTAEQLKLLLKLMRIVQEEENIRRHTRLLERRREFDEEYGEKARNEAEAQDKNHQRLKEVIAKVPPQARRNLDLAGKAMDDAAALLRLPQTDGATVAAETEVIERLTAGAGQAASAMGGSAGMSAMMQMLMQQLGMSSGPAGGGSMQGGGGNPADAGDGGTASPDARDPRRKDKVTGKSLDDVPPEFRDALRLYFDEVDKLER